MRRMKNKKSPAVRVPAPAPASTVTPRAVARTNTRINAPAAPRDTQISRERIADRAYALWLAAGQPEGRDLEHWFEAQRQLGLDETAASPDNSETHTAATAREVGSEEFPDRLEEDMDEVASPPQQRSATALDL